MKFRIRRIIGKVRRKFPIRWKKRYIDTTVRFKKGVKPYYK